MHQHRIPNNPTQPIKRTTMLLCMLATSVQMSQPARRRHVTRHAHDNLTHLIADFYRNRIRCILWLGIFGFVVTHGGCVFTKGR